jgi:hypothetical protein
VNKALFFLTAFVVFTFLPRSWAQDIPKANTCASPELAWRSDSIPVQWIYDRNNAPYDLINLYIHEINLETLRAVLRNADWFEAEAMPPKYFKDVIAKQLKAGRIIKDFNNGKKVDPAKVDWAKNVVNTGPISAEYFCGKPQITGFEKHKIESQAREHFRIFDTGQKDDRGCMVFAVSSSLDTKLKFPDFSRANQDFVNHAIEPNVDGERDAVFESLQQSSAFESAEVVNLNPTPHSPNSGAYSQDGKVYDIRLAGCGI